MEEYSFEEKVFSTTEYIGKFFDNDWLMRLYIMGLFTSEAYVDFRKILIRVSEYLNQWQIASVRKACRTELNEEVI